MKKETTQHKLDRVRPPRVQITYDVETGGAIEKKSLPLVVGVMADLAGNAPESRPPMKARKFVEVDRDNLNAVMASIAPRLALKVDNRIVADADAPLNVELAFRSMDDFNPRALIERIEPLSRLFKARTDLSDLLTKLDGNDELEAELKRVSAGPEELEKIKADMEAAAAPPAA
jgi:type VI secretion system protein ImpB